MSGLSSSYIDEIQDNIRVRPIPWDGYVRANLFSAEEATLIKTIDKQAFDKSSPSSLDTSKADGFANTVVDLLNRLTREDVVKYILSLTGDLISTATLSEENVDEQQQQEQSRVFTKALLNATSSDATIYSVLTNILETGDDEQTWLLAARVFVGLVNVEHKAPEDYIDKFLTFCSSKLIGSSDVNLQEVGVQSVKILLETRWYRDLVWHKYTELIEPLLSLLRLTSRSNIQLQYSILVVFWLLTFDKTPSKQLSVDLAPILLDISKNSVKEKIVRVSVATLTNTVNQCPKVSIPSILSHQGLTVIKMLSERKWTDNELIEDLSTLATTLQDAVTSMSTFDEYSSEVIGKKLTWSPAHKSEVFWKENIGKFKQDNWKIVKQIGELLMSANTDNTSLAVACSDISYIIKEEPESVKVLESLGAKIKVMELMNSPDSEVRYQALKATQMFIAHSFK